MIIFDAGEIYNKPKKNQKKQYNRKKDANFGPMFPSIHKQQILQQFAKYSVANYLLSISVGLTEI